jgi:hypothetical protein
MIRSAPTMRAPWMTLSPMPPRPNTATLAPGQHFGGVDHRADAGRHPAADVADLVERRVLADFGERDLRQHREIRESRAAHVVEHGVAARARASQRKRLVPSGITPLPWVARMAVHRFERRDRQVLHCRHSGV